MKLDVNGLLSGLRQILGIASVFLGAAVLLKLFHIAPASILGTIYDLSAVTIATAFASK